MLMERQGHAYLVEENSESGEGEGEDEDECLSELMSPTSGYSSGEEGGNSIRKRNTLALGATPFNMPGRTQTKVPGSGKVKTPFLAPSQLASSAPTAISFMSEAKMKREDSSAPQAVVNGDSSSPNSRPDLDFRRVAKLTSVMSQASFKSIPSFDGFNVDSSLFLENNGLQQSIDEEEPPELASATPSATFVEPNLQQSIDEEKPPDQASATPSATSAEPSLQHSINEEEPPDLASATPSATYVEPNLQQSIDEEEPPDLPSATPSATAAEPSKVQQSAVEEVFESQETGSSGGNAGSGNAGWGESTSTGSTSTRTGSKSTPAGPKSTPAAHDAPLAKDPSSDEAAAPPTGPGTGSGSADLNGSQRALGHTLSLHSHPLESVASLGAAWESMEQVAALQRGSSSALLMVNEQPRRMESLHEVVADSPPSTPTLASQLDKRNSRSEPLTPTVGSRLDKGGSEADAVPVPSPSSKSSKRVDSSSPPGAGRLAISTSIANSLMDSADGQQGSSRSSSKQELVGMGDVQPLLAARSENTYVEEDDDSKADPYSSGSRQAAACGSSGTAPAPMEEDDGREADPSSSQSRQAAAGGSKGVAPTPVEEVDDSGADPSSSGSRQAAAGGRSGAALTPVEEVDDIEADPSSSRPRQAAAGGRSGAAEATGTDLTTGSSFSEDTSMSFTNQISSVSALVAASAQLDSLSVATSAIACGLRGSQGCDLMVDVEGGSSPSSPTSHILSNSKLPHPKPTSTPLVPGSRQGPRVSHGCDLMEGIEGVLFQEGGSPTMSDMDEPSAPSSPTSHRFSNSKIPHPKLTSTPPVDAPKPKDSLDGPSSPSSPISHRFSNSKLPHPKLTSTAPVDAPKPEGTDKRPASGLFSSWTAPKRASFTGPSTPSKDKKGLASAMAPGALVDLSMCGSHLSGENNYKEATTLFDAYAVESSDFKSLGPQIMASPFDAYAVESSDFKSLGPQIMASPDLMVRLDGVIYPWSAAGPCVLGLAAYGECWTSLIPPGTPCWAPDGTMDAGASVRDVVMGMSPGNAKKKMCKRIMKVEVGAIVRDVVMNSSQGKAAKESGIEDEMQVGHVFQEEGAPGVEPGTLRNSRSSNALLSLLPAKEERRKNQGKTLNPNSDQLKSMNLRFGQNIIRFKAGNGAEIHAYIYLCRWNTKLVISDVDGTITRSDILGHLLPSMEFDQTSTHACTGANRTKHDTCAHWWNTKLVISDIDGTITRSDVLGHLLPAMGFDWSHTGVTKLFTDIARNGYQFDNGSDVLGHLIQAMRFDWSHTGVMKLFNGIARNGYQVMYLSSRAITQANITRGYINTLVQGAHRMPIGPVIISPHGLLPSLYREVILRRPHEFKIGTLQDVRALFPLEWNPFWAAFGNRDTDELSYREVGVPTNRIFIINPKSELRQASLALQTSTLSSLNAINSLVCEIFPPLESPLPPGLTDESQAVKGGSDVSESPGVPAGAQPIVQEIFNDVHYWVVNTMMPIVQEIFNDMHYWGFNTMMVDIDSMEKQMQEEIDKKRQVEEANKDKDKKDKLKIAAEKAAGAKQDKLKIAAEKAAGAKQDKLKIAAEKAAGANLDKTKIAAEKAAGAKQDKTKIAAEKAAESKQDKDKKDKVKSTAEAVNATASVPPVPPALLMEATSSVEGRRASSAAGRLSGSNVLSEAEASGTAGEVTAGGEGEVEDEGESGAKDGVEVNGEGGEEEEEEEQWEDAVAAQGEGDFISSYNPFAL
eukprot:gene16304-22491_t